MLIPETFDTIVLIFLPGFRENHSYDVAEVISSKVYFIYIDMEYCQKEL